MTNSIKLITLFSIIVLTLSVQANAFAQTKVTVLPNGSLILDDFKSGNIGDVPSKWFNRDGNQRIADSPASEQEKYRYRIQEEAGKRYLRYSGMNAMHMNLPVRDTKEFTLSTHPYLSWEWRVHSIPKGATEDDDKRNDTAASIYVVYEISGLFKIPKVIRYTWSSTLPKGSYLTKGRQRILVMESGESRLNEWIRFERNIAEDYRNFFGEEPPERPLAILILSDANNTKSFAFADYGPIMLHKTPQKTP